MATSLAMTPEGIHSAASNPSVAATCRSRRRTVGSSPHWSSPTSASAMARRMAGVGRVTVSERRSTGRSVNRHALEGLHDALDRVELVVLGDQPQVFHELLGSPGLVGRLQELVTG